MTVVPAAVLSAAPTSPAETAVPAPEATPAAHWLGAAGLLATLLLAEMPPGFAWFDSGELSAAALQLGVPHPTGFALFDLAGHTLARLPLGPAVLRVHFLGALSAVGALALWWRCWPRLLQIPRWAEALAWCVPLTIPAVFQHVRAAEVYAPTWLLAAATVAVWQAESGPRRLARLGLLVGLAVAVHVEAALLAGGALALAATLRWQTVSRRGVGWAAVLCVAGGVVLLYLPLAAMRHPAFSWGDVQTIPALLDHLTGATIRAAFADRMGGVREGVAALAHLIWRDAGWLLVPAVLGGVDLYRRRALWPTLAIAAADAVYSVTLNPMGLRDNQAGLLVLLVVGLLAVRGVLSLASWRLRVLGWPAMAWLVAAAGTGHARIPAADLAAAQAISDHLWRDIPPGAVLLAASDHTASACILAQTVDGVRPDAACLPLQLLRDPRNATALAVTRRMPELAGLADDTGARLPLRERLQRLLAVWRDRAVGWELGSHAEDSVVLPLLRPAWPWNWLEPGGGHPVGTAVPWMQAVSAECGAELAGCGGRPTLAHHLAAAAALHGALRLDSAPNATVGLLTLAVAMAPDDPKALNNLAAQEVLYNHPARALALCEAALRTEPDYARAHRTAARAAFLAGQPEAALAHAGAYVRARPWAEAGPWLEELSREAPEPWSTRLRLLAPR